MRIVLVILLILTATILGGLYGALYDQITYSISEEFFTKMRFPQFGISGNINERWEAGKIGFKNSWPVGLGLGLFLSVAGLLHSNNKKMILVTAKAFGLVMFCSFLFATIAFLFIESSIEISSEINVIDKVAFNKVSNMNNYSYVGGIIGMFLGLGWQVLSTRQTTKK